MWFASAAMDLFFIVLVLVIALLSETGSRLAVTRFLLSWQKNLRALQAACPAELTVPLRRSVQTAAGKMKYCHDWGARLGRAWSLVGETESLKVLSSTQSSHLSLLAATCLSGLSSASFLAQPALKENIGASSSDSGYQWDSLQGVQCLKLRLSSRLLPQPSDKGLCC